MLRMLAGCACFLILGIALVAGTRLNDDCNLTLRLTDAETGQTVPGLVRFRDGDGDGKTISVAELFPRNLTPGVEQRIDNWSVIVKPTTVKVPRGKLIIEAFFGLETERARVTVDLTGKAEDSITV
ncbi:MAG: hypothetical protein JWN70_4230, partial [Planctomycetaceae bacterium]|nr:hypothetical protein [Planctomycetaceae bacterium]